MCQFPVVVRLPEEDPARTPPLGTRFDASKFHTARETCCSKLGWILERVGNRGCWGGEEREGRNELMVNSKELLLDPQLTVQEG